MACVGNPWSTRRVGHALLDEVVRKVLLTYWNTASFLVLYANANGWSPDQPVAPAAERPLLDRWALSELHQTVREVETALEDFDSTRAGRALTAFVDDLSNWYVRRSRRRFWDGDPAALATLHECLEVLTRLLAPFVPFVTDEVHERLVRDVDPAAADSVHLRAWPTADSSLVDRGLAEHMALVRRVVELGRSARADASVKTRQPLARAMVAAPGWETLPDELRAHVADELNVRSLDTLAAAGDLVDVTVKPNFRTLGKRFGSRTPTVAAALQSADGAALVARLRNEGTAVVDVDGERVELEPDDLVVTETPRAGWAVASDGTDVVALDLELTADLRRAGIVREVIRLVQEGRKAQGFDVSDRIELWWAATDEETAAALRDGHATLAAEVLAVALTEGRPTAPLTPHEHAELGVTFWLRVVD
jgi:isoleucyl-tRNA synthetase